jgi:AraC-like DNA-binding protein
MNGVDTKYGLLATGYFGYKPEAPLAQYIGNIWLWVGDGSQLPRERALPEGTAELVISLSDRPIQLFDQPDSTASQSIQGPIVYGPHSEYFVIERSLHRAILGIHFRLGGALPFLGHAADDLHNLALPLESLLGGTAIDLHDQLREARTPSALFHTIEAWLLARMRPIEHHPAVGYALREIARTPADATIARIAHQIGLSTRRLGQTFSAEVGLTPKLFCRVRRFQETLTQIALDRPVDWAGVAHDCGYFDQSHLIRDFRAFSGLSPTAYLAQRAHHRSHVVEYETQDPRPRTQGDYGW